MNKQSWFNAEQIEKDKFPESKNRLKINSLSAKSVLAGEKLVATYSISTYE
jgi:hypothetical protein